MNRTKNIFKLENKAAAIFMVIALLWLTVSMPFVNAVQQQQQAYANSLATDEEAPCPDDTTTTNPFGNSTEEKAESGSGTLSEYLHHMHELIHPAGLSHQHNGSHDADVYVAFHGEMLCPPPNFILS
jgi:hypothetical protein